MKPVSIFTLFLAAVICSLDLYAAHHESDVLEDKIWVRPGYELIVADGSIRSPRFMEVTPDGTLYVTITKRGEIKTLFDEDQDGKYEKVVTYAKGYDFVHAVEWHDGWLWFSQTFAIHKSRDTNNDGVADEIVEVIGRDQLDAEEGGHSWRALMIHNNRIYTHIGDQTNSTDQEIDDSDRKKIFTFALDGSDKKEFASGVRNTEEFGIRPGTNEIWGADHDIDKLYESMEKSVRGEWGQPFTDLNPAAEFNHYVEGGFYGHPFILANRLPNPQFIFRQDLVELASKTIVPEWLMPAHCSANGMAFYDDDQFPDARGDAFIAMRGGWNNAAEKVGYCVQRILFEFGKPYGSKKYVNFLTSNQEVLGRPADVAVDNDGSLLITDDTENHIYRLRYVGN